MQSSTLPHYSGPVDPLRNGFRNLEAEKNVEHPIKIMQDRKGGSDWLMKLDTVSKTYGSHMAMRLETEKQMLDRPHRLPGMESSKIALQTVMGTDESMDFSDFLNGKGIHDVLDHSLNPNIVIYGWCFVVVIF